MHKTVVVIIGAVIGLLVAWLLPGTLTVFTAIVGVVIGLIGGIIVAAILLGRSRGESAADIVQEVAKAAVTPDPDARERRVHEPLVRANQALRLDGEVSQAVLLAFESLIDKIRLLIPKALEASSGSEATYKVESLGHTDLPDYVQSYLGLSNTNRASREETLLKQLKTIDDVLTAAIEQLERGQVQEFETQHGFMDLKF